MKYSLAFATCQSNLDINFLNPETGVHPPSCNDNKGPSLFSRIRNKLTLESFHRGMLLFTERFAAFGLGLHFLLFMGMPFMLMEYVIDRIFGGSSKPDIVNGLVMLKVPEQTWKGFFWFVNFYGALILLVLVLVMLYTVWDRGFRNQPMVRLTTKAFMCAAVATGLPLKLVYRFAMMTPENYAPDLNYLGVLDVTQIARAGFYSFEGGWFFSRFAILPPIFLLVTYIVGQMLENRAKETSERR